jgi:phosphatidylglycerophosphatase A
MNLLPKSDDFVVIRKLNLKDPWIWLATWFGMGFLRPAPGTWGSLGALPFGIIIYMASGVFGLLIAIFILGWFGARATQAFQNQTDTDDNKMIVVDEVAGQWIPLLAAGLNPWLIGFSFILFRFFDITKIWPVNWCEKKIPGALGVMADDIAAGLYALICIMGLRYAGFG